MQTSGTLEKRFSLLSLVDDIVPLVGLLFLGWNPAIVLPLYWVENLAVGYYTYRKLMLPDIQESQISTTGVDGVKRQTGRKELAYFFVMHYGIFTLVHGVFAFTAIPAAVAQTGSTTVDMGPLGWAVPAALLTAFFAERVRYVQQTATPQLRAQLTQGKIMGSAYVRIIVLHVSILVGATLITMLGLPQGAAVLLILLKMFVEAFKANMSPLVRIK